MWCIEYQTRTDQPNQHRPDNIAMLVCKTDVHKTTQQLDEPSEIRITTYFMK